MSNMSSKEIRSKFLKFFQENEHLIIENSSIIPKNDPTLLFINSGMAPLKKFFTGEENPPKERLCNIQPCIRTIDIDEIGDKHHLTSFQMLGSWSINNYFKEDAIKLAYEFLTKYLNIPKDKLYVTVFSGDKNMGVDEDADAQKFWEKVGVDKSHIVQCGREDNFWGPTSEIGPCGPCTEVFYDTGEGDKNKYVPGGEFDTKNRYIEIWNAGVFMQFNKNADGTYSKLSFTSVDTGAGLERLSMVLNGHSSVYDTDMLKPIKDKVYSNLGNELNISEREIRVLTDHLRTTCLILSENVVPSNEGRGYIPRKLIRKCIMIVKKSKIRSFKFDDIIKFITNTYSVLYPSFPFNADYIIREFNKEREQFEKVLTKGLEKLDEIKNGPRIISGNDAFELVTTYGMPFEIIKDFSVENSVSLDENEFQKRLEKHKEISKCNQGHTDIINHIELEELKDFSKTDFKGYQNYECKSKISGIFVGGKRKGTAKKGDSVSVTLDSSCMYAESGGQCADIGSICNDNCTISICNVRSDKKGTFIHEGVVEEGEIDVGECVQISFDKSRRRKLANNHTAVHLLQSALRTMYGSDLHQAGSKVEEDKLRFDFNYDNLITQDDIYKIENMVNSYIRDNIKCHTEIKDLSEAINEGAIALFENKYSENVRVVSFGNVSKELCGGTHTEYTGNIGIFVIVSSEGIGKGVKRITALTGQNAIDYIHRKNTLLNEAASLLKVKPESILDRIKKKICNENKSIPIKVGIDNSEVTKIDNSPIACAYVVKPERSKLLVDELSNLSEKINGVAVCICGDKKHQIIVSSCSSIRKKVKANEFLGKIMQLVGGKGGGNERLASGGTESNIDKICSVIKETILTYKF